MGDTKDGNNSDVANMFLQMLEPTAEDLARKFTNEELIKLCLKRKCRVDMWKWNLVNEYRILFEEEGRYQKWDDIKKRKMLKKAVNKTKATIAYSDEEIAKIRRKEWEWELKDCILSLNLWEYDEKKEKERQEQMDITADADTNANNRDLKNEPEEFSPSDVSNSTAIDLELKFSEEDCNADMDIPSNTQDKLTTVTSDPNPLEVLFDVNTESMTIDSEALLTLLNVTNDPNSLERLFDVNTDTMTIDSEDLLTDESE